MSDLFKRERKLMDEARRLLGPTHDLRALTGGLQDANPAALGLTDKRALIDALGAQDLVATALRHSHISSGMDAQLKADAIRAKMMADLMGSGALGRMAQGVEAEKLRTEQLFGQAKLAGVFAQDMKMAAAIQATVRADLAYQSKFMTVAVQDAIRLAATEQSKMGLAFETFRKAGGDAALIAAIGEMRSPWLRIDDAARSVRAFSEVVAIGHGVASSLPFDEQFASTLRQDLGDWRDPMSVNIEAVSDPVHRTELYADQGYQSDLTDFPAPAFDQAMVIAGLRQELDAIDAEGGGGDGLQRAQRTFGLLQKLEVAVREFIVTVMQSAIGDNWMRTHLPQGMLDSWTGKREAAIRAGSAPGALIDYADFTDYRMIIEKSQNWNLVFKPIFGRVEDVRESFQRLFPVRIATMHARVITLDDELLALVEVRRIHRAIRKS
ncbi:Swt1 family HEPN domain-containing protein [Asticcacaulis benevestitus]|nr:Swt1 family HEPN domain-containing protein [Asticcacaulis benevestitus]